MQIAMLAAGEGSLALRKSLSEHLLRCSQCREILVAVILSDKQATSTLGAVRDRAEVTVASDADLIERVLDLSSNSVTSTVGRVPARCIIPLSFHQTEAVMMAANETTDTETEPIAICSSGDDKYKVTFFHAGEDGGYRAVVERQSQSDRKPQCLTFPALDLAFPLDSDGKTETMNIEGMLLGMCRVDVEV